MDEREALIQTIIDNPDDDVPRLVFADWQEEHGQIAHAELIRVQCALARLPGAEIQQRKKLQAREKKLLNVPEMNEVRCKNPRKDFSREIIPGFYSIDSFDRGFIQTGFLRYSHVNRSEQEAIQPFLDRILTIDYYFESKISFKTDWVQSLMTASWLPRIVRFVCHQSRLTVQSLRLFACCPGFKNIRSVVFASNVAVETLADFLLSPHLQALREIQLSGYFTVGDQKHDRITQVDNHHVNEVMQQIFRSPSIRTWKRFIIDTPGIGETGMPAVLESPYLNTIERLRFDQAFISDSLAQRLRDRFGDRISLPRNIS